MKEFTSALRRKQAEAEQDGGEFDPEAGAIEFQIDGETYKASAVAPAGNVLPTVAAAVSKGNVQKVVAAAHLYELVIACLLEPYRTRLEERCTSTTDTLGIEDVAEVGGWLLAEYLGRPTGRRPGSPPGPSRNGASSTVEPPPLASIS